MILFCLVFAMSSCASVYMCFVVTCWERADHLALVCGVSLCVCHFPIGILGQVWYLILLYTYKKYPLILPIFLHKNTKSCITLLAFSDSVSPSPIVYPRRTTFTLDCIWVKPGKGPKSESNITMSFFPRFSVRKKDSMVVCTFDVTNDVILMR